LPNLRLQAHFFGEIELTAAQIRTAEILLRKCLPDLARAEIKSEETHRYVVEVPPVLDRDEWQRKYGQNPSLPPWVGVRPVNVRDDGEIERVITAFARGANGGLIVTGSALAQVHRKLIITLAARYKLPAVYFDRFFVTDGGLISYGPDLHDQYRRAAGYIDRILKGEKPTDLAVQAATKYELVVNLKTAKALGLTVPDAVLARADEVIE
jgi:hypothetical protein